MAVVGAALIQETFTVPEYINGNTGHIVKAETEINAIIIGVDAIVGHYLEFMDADKPVELLADPDTVKVNRFNTGPHTVVSFNGVVADGECCNFHGSLISFDDTKVGESLDLEKFVR